MKTLTTIIISFFLILSWNAQSKIVQACNYCAGQFLDAAKTHSPYVDDKESVYVVDLIWGETKKYQARYRGTRDGEAPIVDFVELVPETSIINATKDMYNKIGVNRGLKVDVDPSLDPTNPPINSIIDLLDDARGQDRFDNYLHAAKPLNYWTLQLTSAFGGIVFDWLRGVPIRFTFKDGSSGVFKTFDMTENEKMTFQYVPGTAEDADGNKIPESDRDMLKDFTFRSANTFGAFKERAQTRFGFNFTSDLVWRDTTIELSTTCYIQQNSYPPRYECKLNRDR